MAGTAPISARSSRPLPIQLRGRVIGLGVCSLDLTRASPPCGAFVIGTQNGTEVGFLDPALALGLTGNEALGPLGIQATTMLQRVLAAV